MKTTFIYITIQSMFLFHSFAQKANLAIIDKKVKIDQKIPDTLIDDKPTSMITARAYLVEENINQKFGGHTMTYEVPDFSLINQYDLGPNNTRTITPLYKEVKQTSNPPIEASNNYLKPTKVITTKNEVEPINANIIIPPLKEELPITTDDDKYLYVFLIKTYERVAEKGYKSVEIFQKLGDNYFFIEKYAKAAKWYEELFAMTTALDSEYYDRYAHALKAIGQKEKAKEIIEKRDQLFSKN